MTIEKAKKKIITAGVFGLISTFVTLAAVLYVTQTGKNFENLSMWTLLDVFLMAFCTFGIFMKSRTAAIIMFVYFLISKIDQWVNHPNAGQLLFGLVFLIAYFEGVRGCMYWHRRKKEELNQRMDSTLETAQ